MSFENLPPSWSLATLSDAISLNGIIADGDWVESKDQDENGSVRLIQLADIGDGDFRNKSERFMNIETANRLNCTFLEKGDVLIARMPDPLGRACIFPGIGQDAVTVVDVCLIRPSSISALQNRILMYWINTPQIRNQIELQATGTTRKRITRRNLEAFELPIPPLVEQTRIAKKLDELLAQVDTLKARLDAIPKILKRFRQSVLAAAVSGKLTEEWRRHNRVSMAWDNLVFSELLASIRSGASDVPSDDANGIPILRSSAVRSMAIDYGDIRYLSSEGQLKAENFLKSGDLLFTRLSGSPEYVGSCALVKNKLLVEVQYSDRVFCARLKNKENGSFLELYFSSLGFRSYIYKNLKSSAGHQRITTDVIKNAALLLPTIEEQKEIVKKVEQLFTFADQIEQRVKDAQTRVNHLTQSILAKAFRGELVPQDPNDEPAEKLLERIRAERESEKKTKVPRGKTR